LAPLGTRMTVCSLTPSLIGIFTVRRSWSKPALLGANLGGVSLGKVGAVGGGAGVCAATGKAESTSTSPTSWSGEQQRFRFTRGILPWPAGSRIHEMLDRPDARWAEQLPATPGTPRAVSARARGAGSSVCSAPRDHHLEVVAGHDQRRPPGRSICQAR
jgi:hypothetical protein